METPVKDNGVSASDKQHATANTPSSLVSSSAASKSSASSTKSRRRRGTAMRIPTAQEFQSFQSWNASQCRMVARDLLFVGLRHSTWFGNLASGGIGFYGYLQLLYIQNSSLELSHTKQTVLIKQIYQDYLQQTLKSIQLKYSSEFLNLTQPTLWNSDWMAAYVLNMQALLQLQQHSKAKQLALFCLHKLEPLTVQLDSIQSCSIQTGLCGRIQFVLKLRNLFQDDKMGSTLVVLCAKRIFQIGMVTAEQVAAQERRRKEKQKESSCTNANSKNQQRLSQVQQTRLSFEQQASSSNETPNSLPLLWKSPEHSNAIVLGLSYGVMGILHTLLSLSDDDYHGIAIHSPLLSKPNAISNAKEMVKQTIDTLMQYSKDKHSDFFYETSGNLKPACSSTTSDNYVTVQHGMTGLVLLLLQASQIYQDGSYFDYANELATLHVWPRGISGNFHLGLTTGTSGNALTMLLLAQACQDDSIAFVWKRRCEYLVQSMILHLTESMTGGTTNNTKRFSLMHGMGGLVAVLLQLYSNQVEFPWLSMELHTQFPTQLYDVPKHVWKNLTPQKRSSPTSTSTSPDEQERLKRQTRRLEYAEQVAPSPSKRKQPQQKLPHSPSTHSPGHLLLTSTPTQASTLNSIIPKTFDRTSSLQRQKNTDSNLPHYMQATAGSSVKKRLTPSPIKLSSPSKQKALSTVKRNLHFMTPTKASTRHIPATEPVAMTSKRTTPTRTIKPRTLHYLTPTKSTVAHSVNHKNEDPVQMAMTKSPSVSQTHAMERLANPNRFKVKKKQQVSPAKQPSLPSQAQINAMERLATPKKRSVATEEPPVIPTPSPRRRTRTTPKKKTPQQVLEGRQAFAARMAIKKETTTTTTTSTSTTSHVSNLLQSFQQLRNQPAKEKEESLEEQQRKAAEAASMDQMALLLEQKRIKKLEQDKQKLEEKRRVEERKKEHAKLVEAQRQQEQASARALRAQQREATRLKIEKDKQQAALKKAEAAQKRAAEKERRDQLAMEKLKQREEQARKEASARKAAFAKARAEQDRLEQERRNKKAMQLQTAKEAQQQQAQANQKRAKLRQEAMEDARSKALQESQRRAKAQADAEDKRRKDAEAAVKKKRSAEELRLKKAKEQAEQQEAARIQQAKEAKAKKEEQARKKQQEDAARLEALRIQKAKEEEEAATVAEALRIQKEKDEAEREKAEQLRIQKEKEEAERIRIEQEKAGAERIRIEKEKAEAERVEKEKAEAAEAARIQKEEEEEAERIQKEKEEAEEARLKQEKEQQAATVLQSRVRAFTTRKAFRRDVAAATKIQAATRAGIMRLNMKRFAEQEAQEKKRFEEEGKALEDGMKSATTAEDSPDLDKKSSSKASKWKKRLANKTKAKVSPSNSVDNEEDDDFVPESLRGMFEEADRVLSAEKESILNDPALVGIRSMPSDEAAETPISTIDSMPSDEDGKPFGGGGGATSMEAQEMPAEKDSPQDATVDVPAPSLAEAEVESDSVAETESPSKDEVTPTKKSSGRAAKWKARLGKKGSSKTPDTSDDETNLESADVSKWEEVPAPTDSSPALTDEQKLLAALKQAKTSSEEQTGAAVKAKPDTDPAETVASAEVTPSPNLTMCSSCNIGRAKSEFSKAQLKKPASTRKCKSCVEASVAREEEDRLKAEEQARVAAEKEKAARLKAEEDRIAAEKAQAEEQARLAAEKEEAARVKAEEEAKVAAEVEAARIKAEEERVATEKAKLEEARIKAEEEARKGAERAKAEEEARIKAEQEEAARIKAEEKVIAKQKELQEQARLKAEQEEAVRIKAEEARLAAERAEAEEAARLAAEKAKAEEERVAAEKKAKAEEEARLAAEKAKAEEERLAAEKKVKAEEEARLAADKAKAEEERLAAEKKAEEEEEARVAAEKVKAVEEARLAAEKAKEEEEARLAAEAEVVRISMEKAQAAFEAEERRLADMKEAKEKETQAVTNEVAKMYVEERRKSLESATSVDSAGEIAISESTDDDASPNKDAGSSKKKDRASKWKKRLAAKSGGKIGRKNSRDSSDDEVAVIEEATANTDDSKRTSSAIPNSDGEKHSNSESMEPNHPIVDGDNHNPEAQTTSTQSEQDQSIDKPIDDAEQSKKSDEAANVIPELATQSTDEQSSPMKSIQSPAAVVSQPTDEDADELMTPADMAKGMAKGILFDHSGNDDKDNPKDEDIGLDKIEATEADDDDKTSSNVPALSKDDEDFARSRSMALLAGMEGNDATSPSKSSSNSDSGGGGIWGRLKQGASQAATQLDEATAKEGGIFGLGLRKRMGSKDEDLR